MKMQKCIFGKPSKSLVKLTKINTKRVENHVFPERCTIEKSTFENVYFCLFRTIGKNVHFETLKGVLFRCRAIEKCII